MSDKTRRESPLDPGLTIREPHAEPVGRSPNGNSEDLSATTREEAPGSTMREGNGGNSNGTTTIEGARPTVRESQAVASERDPSNYRATPEGDFNTRRSTFTLPPEISGRFQLARELPARGSESDNALLIDAKTGETVFFKYYRLGIRPNTVVRDLMDADTRHIVTILEFHEALGDDERSWEIQEYCSIGSLKDWAAVNAPAGVVDRDVLLSIVRELYEALKYLEDFKPDQNRKAGIRHGDLKPANILVRTEDPFDLVLADFGLAQGNAATHFTDTAKGTWLYAAPEIHGATGNNPDKKPVTTSASDWFALGAIIYELYTGRALFSDARGNPLPDDRARIKCLTKDYDVDLVADQAGAHSWKLLISGLVTNDYEHRWGSQQVKQWLDGARPDVVVDFGATIDSEIPRAHDLGFTIPWNGNLVTHPDELADAFRASWDEAARLVSGRVNVRLVDFIEGTTGEAAQKIIETLNNDEHPDLKLLRLQQMLDQKGPIEFRGTALNSELLSRRIELAQVNKDDLNWLDQLLRSDALFTIAEISGLKRANEGARKLRKWQRQADDLIEKLPHNMRAVGQRAFHASLPELYARAFAIRFAPNSDPHRAEEHESHGV